MYTIIVEVFQNSFSWQLHKSSTSHHGTARLTSFASGLPHLREPGVLPDGVQRDALLLVGVEHLVQQVHALVAQLSGRSRHALTLAPGPLHLLQPAQGGVCSARATWVGVR